MQVRKFEANTMQEALRLVKTQLGPDAIILSAKDVKKGFGLGGDKSVEVTAAVSELTLKKKHVAEARLREQDKQKFENISARKQKQFIEKVLDRMEQSNQPPSRITSTQYIDIVDEHSEANTTAPVSSDSIKEQLESRVMSAEMRIRSAAEEASRAVDVLAPQEMPEVEPKINLKTDSVPAVAEATRIIELENEIRQLKGVISEFQNMPQTFISMHPGASEGIPFELSSMYEKLIRSGIRSEYVCEILKLAQQALPGQQLKKPAIVNAWVAKHILENVTIARSRCADRYQVFVGPSGQGKTSSLVKMASHLVICERRPVAIVTTDTSKVGASEQLKIYAKILNVPFATVRRQEDWQKVNQSFKDCENIFVDTSASSLRSMGELDDLKDILPSTEGGRALHYVTSVLAKDEEALDMAQRYKALGIDDVIFTCIDEAVQHGSIYNMQRRFGLPLHSFGIGSNIPEDFEPATKERVVDLLFKLTKISKERGHS